MSHIVRCFTTAPKGLDEEMIQKIVKRDEELRRDYYDMPSSFPETSQPPSGHVTMVHSCVAVFSVGGRAS